MKTDKLFWLTGILLLLCGTVSASILGPNLEINTTISNSSMTIVELWTTTNLRVTPISIEISNLAFDINNFYFSTTNILNWTQVNKHIISTNALNASITATDQITIRNTLNQTFNATVILPTSTCEVYEVTYQPALGPLVTYGNNELTCRTDGRLQVTNVRIDHGLNNTFNLKGLESGNFQSTLNFLLAIIPIICIIILVILIKAMLNEGLSYREVLTRAIGIALIIFVLNIAFIAMWG